MNITINKAEKGDYKIIKKLFLSAFPPEERPPFIFLKKRSLDGRCDMLTIKNGNSFAGFASVLCFRDMAYLFLFAIEEDCRGNGIGSRVLELIKEKYKDKRIFLAREVLDESAENYIDRVRRRGFYMRNGFYDLPGKIKEAGVVYDIMGTGKGVSSDEYKEIMQNFLGRIFFKFVDVCLIED